jgi:hypothetical protein
MLSIILEERVVSHLWEANPDNVRATINAAEKYGRHGR